MRHHIHRGRDRSLGRRDIGLAVRRYRPDRYEYRVEYSIDGENLGTPWKAMITGSGHF
jgi:GntR family transcriptional regulator